MSSSSSTSETLKDETPSTSTIQETETKTLESQTPVASISPSDKETLEDKEPEESNQANVASNGGEGAEDEEEGECGFCLYMKGGGCKDNFVAWEKCIEDAEKSNEVVAEKCYEVTLLLKKCMEAHSDYYGPLLEAEKAAEAQVVKEFVKETKLKDEASEAAMKEKQES